MPANVTATLTDIVGANVAKPGDTLNYEVTITNSGTDPADSVAYNETSSGVTVNVASIEVTPIAFDDAGAGFSLAGNTPQTFTAAQLLGNDVYPDGPAASLVIASVDNAVNGTVVLNGDGTVTFTPTTGYEGAASFQYTVQDEDGRNSVTTGVVSLTVTDAPPTS